MRTNVSFQHLTRSHSRFPLLGLSNSTCQLPFPFVPLAPDSDFTPLVGPSKLTHRLRLPSVHPLRQTRSFFVFFAVRLFEPSSRDRQRMRISIFHAYLVLPLVGWARGRSILSRLNNLCQTRRRTQRGNIFQFSSIDSSTFL